MPTTGPVAAEVATTPSGQGPTWWPGCPLVTCRLVAIDVAVGGGQPEPRRETVESDAVRIRRGEDAIAGIGPVRGPAAGRERGGTRRDARRGVDREGGRRERSCPPRVAALQANRAPVRDGAYLGRERDRLAHPTTGIAPGSVPVLLDTERVMVVFVVAKTKVTCWTASGATPFVAVASPRSCLRRSGASPPSQSVPNTFGRKGKPRGRVPDVMVRAGVGVPELEISMAPL